MRLREIGTMQAKGALDTALHHVNATQQESDRSGEIDQGEGGGHPPLDRRARFAAGYKPSAPSSVQELNRRRRLAFFDDEGR
jgi:hypothetical protein